MLFLPIVNALSLLRNCPSVNSLQSQYVKQNFDLKAFADGTRYYEIAFKDVTQPRICKCFTSKKQLLPSGQIKDDFKFECNGAVQYSDLRFDTTATKGFLIGTWHQPGLDIFSSIKFRNTIVDVGTSIGANGTLIYDWVVEFQCQEKAGIIWFYAFNFYSRSNTLRDYDAMLKAAKKAGLTRFIEDGLDIKIPSHEDCWYNKQ